MSDGGQKPDFVDRVLYFFGGHFFKFDLFESINGVVFDSFDFENARI